MKLFIPDTKTQLLLKKPWKFRLFEEYRNFSLMDSFKIPHAYRYSSEYRENKKSPSHHEVTLPAGTVLRVHRVFIRQGTADTYDSLTFHIKKCPTKLKGHFWAKLVDINDHMDVEIVNQGKED